jgi:hypothetical protein
MSGLALAGISQTPAEISCNPVDCTGVESSAGGGTDA